MKKNILFALIILIYFNSNVVTQFHLPKIFPTYNEVVVESTLDLILGCAGTEPVTWTVPDSVSKHKYRIKSVDINRGKKIDYRYVFGSILKVTNISVYDIGFYTCHGNKDNSTRAKNIYVYVRDKDILMYSLDNKDSIEMKYFMHINLTLPCMPTSPDVSVTLMKQESQSLHEVTNLVKFDPRTGFQLKMLEMDYQIRKYKCIFSRNGKTQSMTVDIEAHDVPSINRPHIDAPEKFILKYAGDDLKLNCSAVAEKDSLFNLNWALPNNLVVHKVRFFPNVELKKNKLLLSELTVKNLTINDVGLYKCYVGPAYKNDIFHIVHLTVIDRYTKISLPKIDCKSENVTKYLNTSDIIINSSENLILHCESQKNITWSYRNPNHEDLPNTLNNLVIQHSISIENKVKMYNSILFLNNSQYFNGGFYYCHEIETEIDNPYRSSKIFVFVRGEQDLVLSPVYHYQYIFLPLNNYWLPCIPSSPDVIVTLSNKHNVVYDPRYGFKLNDSETEITCEFTRDPYYENKTIYVLTDVDSAFESETNIIAPLNEIQFITKTLVLVCTILVKNIEDFSVDWSIPSRNKIRAVRSDETIQINNAKVLISTLVIQNVKMEDEGNFTCSYKNISFSSVHIRVNPSNTSLYVDDILIMHCNILVDHNIPFHLKWNTIKNNDTRMIPIKVQYKTLLRNVLGRITYDVKNMTKKDQQNISCSAYYGNYSTNSLITEIVPMKPKINKLKIGDTIILTCFAEGSPEPQIVFIKDNDPIEENERVEINKTTLRISRPQSMDSGMYSCRATNIMGTTSKSMRVVVVVQMDSLPYNIYLLTIVILIFLMSIFTLICSIQIIKMKKYSKKLEIQQFRIESFEDFIQDKGFSESDFLPHIKKWELPRNRITLRHKIGGGNFGIVMKADYLVTKNGEGRKSVAVKMFRNWCNFDELNMFLSELKIMMCYVGKHLHIINLLGVCSNNISQGELLIIVEYCKFGDLRNYLLVNRTNFIDENDTNSDTVYINMSIRKVAVDHSVNYNNRSTRSYVNTSDESIHNQLSTKDLIYWSYQIAKGMEYLSSIKILHGDLAARNILMTDNNIVKICDFGLSKNLYNSTNYKKKKQVPLPIKWMAVESIRDGIFSVQSDVWSFGIVLWELFTLGKTPYPDSLIDSEFCNKLFCGYRMEQPQFSSNEIYQIMLDCWHEKPSCRPTFTKLVEILEKLVDAETGKRSNTLDL